ncbi:hypothetical protein V6N13_027047 [Hibiscus sabdariffa]|uniref:Dynein light chain n=2 Tax=Hibiscus sabdariffa TaxID=183260 RepID=A0ABR2NA30_9ROSI
MASKENKHKKLTSFLSSFYRSSAKSQKPKSEPDVAANNKPVSQSLLLKKLENGPTVDKDDQKGNEKECIQGAKVVVEGRKSVSHVETNLASVISFLQVKVLVSDMPGFMQVHAFRCARRTYDSLEKFSSRHMAYNIKKVCSKTLMKFHLASVSQYVVANSNGEFIQLS